MNEDLFPPAMPPLITEDDRLTCEQCGRKFYPAFYDPAVITVSPVWCNACLWAGDEDDL